jgi:hypothetical protein
VDIFEGTKDLVDLVDLCLHFVRQLPEEIMKRLCVRLPKTPEQGFELLVHVASPGVDEPEILDGFTNALEHFPIRSVVRIVGQEQLEPTVGLNH